jgi:exodeoxyribonuclease V gamma subunit
VHACHGPDRQVEVLREVVLGLLRADPTLEPRDVLVMCPDIETFAPLISAAFGLAPADRGVEQGADGHPGHPGQRLRVRLADRALRQVNPVLDTVAQLLELAGARAGASQLLDLLGSPPVRLRFRLDTDDIERITDLVTRSGVRWGLDAAHRAPFRLDGFPQNTWSAGLDRLLLGVAMAADATGGAVDGDGMQWLGTALPLDEVDSGDIARIGRLAEFVERLADVLAALRDEQPLTRWVEALIAGLDALTDTTEADAWQAAQARAELADAARAAGPHAGSVPLGPADVRGLLEERLRGRPGRANFRTGSLTVATLVPMRSVPHRVVCLLGLDDGAFPRAGVPDGDDLLARDPLVGERDPRSEDRQLLLDAICAATEHLVVVHSGADERTGARRPPAVPLGELLDAITATAGERGREQVVVRHPLQPFDARNFTPQGLGGAGPFSFDRAELAGAVAHRTQRARPPAPPPPLLAAPLAPAPNGTVALDDLVAFLEHPVKGFLKQRVGLSLFAGEDEPTDALPVDLDGLARWAVGDRLLRDRLAGHDLDRCRQAEWRRGELPPGALGERLLHDVLDDVEPLVHAAAAYPAGPGGPEDRDVDVPLPDGTRVVGTLGGLHGSVLRRVEYSRLAPKQRSGPGSGWWRSPPAPASGGPRSPSGAEPGTRWPGHRRTGRPGARPGGAHRPGRAPPARPARTAAAAHGHRARLRHRAPRRRRPGRGTGGSPAQVEVRRRRGAGRQRARAGLGPRRRRPHPRARGPGWRADPVRHPRAAAVVAAARRGGRGAAVTPTGTRPRWPPCTRWPTAGPRGPARRRSTCAARCPPAPPCWRPAPAPARRSPSPRWPPATWPRAAPSCPS